MFFDSFLLFISKIIFPHRLKQSFILKYLSFKSSVANSSISSNSLSLFLYFKII